MAKKELFNDDELKALINLVGVFDRADPDGIIYNMPVSTSDTLLELIDSNKNLLDEEKARLKENFDKRKKEERVFLEYEKKEKNKKMIVI